MKSAEQIKGAVKSIAKKMNLKPQEVLQIFMFERLVERLSISKYKENFILKGGLLIASMIGIAERTTMDMDTTIQPDGWAWAPGPSSGCRQRGSRMRSFPYPRPSAFRPRSSSVLWPLKIKSFPGSFFCIGFLSLEQHHLHDARYQAAQANRPAVVSKLAEFPLIGQALNKCLWIIRISLKVI